MRLAARLGAAAGCRSRGSSPANTACALPRWSWRPCDSPHGEARQLVLRVRLCRGERYPGQPVHHIAQGGATVQAARVFRRAKALGSSVAIRRSVDQAVWRSGGHAGAACLAGACADGSADGDRAWGACVAACTACCERNGLLGLAVNGRQGDAEGQWQHHAPSGWVAYFRTLAVWAGAA